MNRFTVVVKLIRLLFSNITMTICNVTHVQHVCFNLHVVNSADCLCSFVIIPLVRAVVEC